MSAAYTILLSVYNEVIFSVCAQLLQRIAQLLGT